MKTIDKIYINGAFVTLSEPCSLCAIWGGKQSSIGREDGTFGLESYLELKAVIS